MKKSQAKTFLIENLTELILIDILSALPFKEVVRLLSSNSSKLQCLFEQAWIQNHATDVAFKDLVKACTISENLKQACCNETILRNLNGVVDITNDVDVKSHLAICADIINKVPGVLHIHIHDYLGGTGSVILELFRDMSCLERVSYITWSSNTLHILSRALRMMPQLVFFFRPQTVNGHSVVFRPGLLNSRHIVDVINDVTAEVTGLDDVKLMEVKKQASLRERRCSWLPGCDYFETEWKM